MSSQPARGRAAIEPTYAHSLCRRDWELLVGLPGKVLLAALSVDSGRSRLPLSDGLAGMSAIAAGRGSPVRLVREVVSAIYAEAAGSDTAAKLVDRSARISVVLAECAAAAAVLADRVPAAEAAGYRRWLVRIATATSVPSRRGGVGTAPVDPSVVGLLAALERALAG